MKKHAAMVIDWFGPYDTLEEAKSYAKDDFGEGLYILIGKTKFQKSPSIIQYIGISKELSGRINNSHSKIAELSQECSIWMGEIASFNIPGPKEKCTNTLVDLAEWLHIYFLDIPLNINKKTLPPAPATLLNRWWHKDYETPRKNRPHKDWPDVIDFTGGEYGAKVVWHSGKQLKLKPSDF